MQPQVLKWLIDLIFCPATSVILRLHSVWGSAWSSVQNAWRIMKAGVAETVHPIPIHTAGAKVW